MRRGPNLFLTVVLVLVGLAALTFLLWQPHVEGRNANATLFEIYFKDPFLAFVYVGSLPFFWALFHAIKLLGAAGGSTEFSAAGVHSVRTIKRCAIALVAFVVVGIVILVTGPEDDHAGPVMLGLILSLGSIVVATAMALLERAMQKAVDMKSEHDLTV